MAFGNNQNRRPRQRRSQNLEFYINDDVKRILHTGDEQENNENAPPQRRERDSNSPKNGGGNRGGPRQSQKPSPEKMKTELCTNLLNGECNYGEMCWFAHGEEELRAPCKTNRSNQTGGQKNKRRNNRRSNGPKNGRGSTTPPSEAASVEQQPALPAVSEQREPEPEAAAVATVQSPVQQLQPVFYPQVNPLTSFPPPPPNVLTRFHFIEPKVGEYEKLQPIIESHARYVEQEMKWVKSIWNKSRKAELK